MLSFEWSVLSSVYYKEAFISLIKQYGSYSIITIDLPVASSVLIEELGIAPSHISICPFGRISDVYQWKLEECKKLNISLHLDNFSDVVLHLNSNGIPSLEILDPTIFDS